MAPFVRLMPFIALFALAKIKKPQFEFQKIKRTHAMFCLGEAAGKTQTRAKITKLKGLLMAGRLGYLAFRPHVLHV